MGVGLDIGSKTIKIVELAQENKTWSLKASGVVGYSGKSPEEASDNKELVPLAEAIKKLHKEAKISSKEVAVALPEPQVFTRTVKFPSLTDSEITSAVKWEAEQYIPIPAKDAIVQHQVIEKLENAAPPQVKVLLIAAPKSLVEMYTRVVEMAGLKLVVLETELMSLIRSLALPDQTLMVVDFGARSTDIAVSKRGTLTFSRSISTAGEAFTRAVAQALNIEDVQAEEYKRTYGLAEKQLEGKISTAIGPIFKMVADEMKKAMHFYQSEEQGDSPTSVVLSGGSANMPDASMVLTKYLGIEVVVGNPFSRVNVDPEAVKTLSGYAPLYSIAVGLAMRGGK